MTSLDDRVCLWKKYAKDKVLLESNQQRDKMDFLKDCLKCEGLIYNNCPNYLSKSGDEIIRYDLIDGDYR